MEFSIKSGSPEKQRCGCVVVGVFEQRQLSLAAELLDNAAAGALSDILRRGDMDGKAVRHCSYTICPAACASAYCWSA